MEPVRKEEIERCLNCKIPKCRDGCPIHNRIPEFIAKMKEENYEEAYRIIRSVSPLGAICGRVCPHENQCQGSCVRGIKEKPISIGELETWVCDWARENQIKIPYEIKENGKKVAIVGGGPAGIACAVDLRKWGYAVTIFEKEDFLGGILMYGIPDYRLSKKLVTEVMDDLLEMGISVEYHTKLVKNNLEGKKESGNISIASLFSAGYEAVFLGIGSEISNLLRIDGVEKTGVYGANEFLRNDRQCKGKRLIVIGGGNVAMDAARVANKEGADVTVVYRKQRENMPANRDEIEDAEHEGVKFIFQTNVIKILGEERVTEVECDTEKIIETDAVVMAIGSTPNESYLEDDLKRTEQGLVVIKENYETTIPNVFAGGDLVQKKATVCMAIKNGKEAALGIHHKLQKENIKK